MSFRTTAILLLLAAVGLGVAIAFVVFADKPLPEVALPSLNGVKISDIDSIEIRRTTPSTEQLDFVKDTQGRWLTRAPTQQRLDANTVLAVVRAVFSAKPVPHTGASAELKTLALDPPTFSITLRVGSEKTATLNIGMTTIGGQDAVTFVTNKDDPTRAFAVPRDALGPLFKKPEDAQGDPAPHMKWLADYRERSLLAADWQDILQQTRTLRIRQGMADVVFDQEQQGRWVFSKPAGLGEADAGGDPQALPDRFTGVRPMLNFLGTLRVKDASDFVENVNPEQIKAFGLTDGDTNTIRIELTPTKGETEVLYLGKVVDAKVKPTQIYAMRLGDNFAVKVTTDRLDAFTKTLADPAQLRSRELLPEIARNYTQRIDLAVGSVTTSLKKTVAQNKELWLVEGTPARPTPPQLVEKLLEELTRPRLATDFAKVGGEPLATVSLWNNGDPAAKADTVLRFTKLPDGKTVVEKVLIGKTVGFLVVPNTLVPMITKPRLDYVNVAMPTFASNFATKVVLQQGKTIVELAKTNDTWAIVQPVNRSAQPVDGVKMKALVEALAGLAPNRVVAEKPTGADLKTFGLNADLMTTVTVTHRVFANNKEELQTVVIEFGAKANVTGFVFAKHTGTDLVYTVPQKALDLVREMITPKP